MVEDPDDILDSSAIVSNNHLVTITFTHCFNSYKYSLFVIIFLFFVDMQTRIQLSGKVCDKTFELLIQYRELRYILSFPPDLVRYPCDRPTLGEILSHIC